MPSYSIRPDDLTSPEVLALLQLHLDEMHRWSPACKVHAMPAERLRAPDVAFFSAWDGDTLAAVGALKDFGGGRGELLGGDAGLRSAASDAGEASVGIDAAYDPVARHRRLSVGYAQA